MKYFEVCFIDDRDCGCVSICCRGHRIPSVEEANIFYKKDTEIYAHDVIWVAEITREDAEQFFDFSDENNWPVFE